MILQLEMQRKKNKNRMEEENDLKVVLSNKKNIMQSQHIDFYYDSLNLKLKYSNKPGIISEDMEIRDMI